MEAVINHVSDDESVSSGPSMDFQLDFNSIQNNQEITSSNSSNNLPKPGPNQPQQSQSHHIFNPEPSSIPVGMGLGFGPRVEYGPIHSEQDRSHQIYPNNSGLGNLSQLGDFSLSLDMGSANPHRINVTPPPNLFFDFNWVVRSTLNTRRMQAHYHSPMPFRLYSTMQRSRKNYESHDGSSNQEQQTSKNSEKQLIPVQPAESRFNHMVGKRARDGAPKHCLVRKCIKFKGQSTQTHGPPLIALKKNLSDDRVTNSVYDLMFEEVGLPIDPHLRLFVPLN